MSCGTAGEELPAAHPDIDVMGTELDAEAHTAGHLGGDHARPRAEKRVIDRLTRPAVVGDRTAHALHGFLCSVPPALLALRVAERVDWRSPRPSSACGRLASGWSCPHAPR